MLACSSLSAGKVILQVNAHLFAAWPALLKAPLPSLPFLISLPPPSLPSLTPCSLRCLSLPLRMHNAVCGPLCAHPEPCCCRWLCEDHHPSHKRRPGPPADNALPGFSNRAVQPPYGHHPGAAGQLHTHCLQHWGSDWPLRLALVGPQLKPRALEVEGLCLYAHKQLWLSGMHGVSSFMFCVLSAVVCCLTERLWHAVPICCASMPIMCSCMHSANVLSNRSS
jgi:hypothetical protein